RSGCSRAITLRWRPDQRTMPSESTSACRLKVSPSVADSSASAPTPSDSTSQRVDQRTSRPIPLRAKLPTVELRLIARIVIDDSDLVIRPCREQFPSGHLPRHLRLRQPGRDHSLNQPGNNVIGSGLGVLALGWDGPGNRHTPVRRLSPAEVEAEL